MNTVQTSTRNVCLIISTVHVFRPGAALSRTIILVKSDKINLPILIDAYR